MVNGYSNGRIEDTNIAGYSPLISPAHLKSHVSLTYAAEQTVREGRKRIKDILNGLPRIVIVMGPCSMHDTEATREYATRSKQLSDRVGDIFEIVIRAYGEKPRTTVGWKGMLYEPFLNGKVGINEGLRIVRTLLRDVAEIGIPAGTEFLDPFVPQYISDLVSWAAIGARTVESPQHRQMVSGLSMPTGLKNNTDGNIAAAVNAVIATRYKGHEFFGLDPNGIPSIVATLGNEYTHIVLRGGNGTNYGKESVQEAEAFLREAGLEERIMIDCSHDNSGKDFKVQPVVFEDVIRQIVDGNTSIMGLMLESHLNEGKQKIPADLRDLQYGVSVTDSCMGWETTEKLILDAHRRLQGKLMFK